MPRQSFRQFRIDNLTKEQINREFDLVRLALNQISTSIERGTAGTNGINGTNGAEVWELEFSMGYGGVGANVIDYVTPASDGYFWFTPKTAALTTAVDNEIFFAAEWRPEKSFSECSLTLDVNDLNLGVHTDNVDIEIVVNSIGTGIGQFGMTSGAYHYQSGFVANSISTSDTVGLRCKLHRNTTYPPSCPGPDSTMNMTAKIIYR